MTVHVLSQCWTPVRVSAVTCVCCGRVDTPVPVRRAPRCSPSTRMNVMPVRDEHTPMLLVWDISWLAPLHPVNTFHNMHACAASTAAWFHYCHVMFWLQCSDTVMKVSVWLVMWLHCDCVTLHMQPLRQRCPCHLHADAWMEEHATLMRVACRSASECER